MSRYGSSYSSSSRGNYGSTSGGGYGGGRGYGGRQDDSFRDTAMPAPKWDSITLIPFEKCFYKPDPAYQKNPEDVEAFRNQWEIKLVGKSIPDPIFDFAEVNLPSEIRSVLAKNNWVKPTPIQSQGWPMALSGRDMVAIARTGSGKTLSYILPSIVHVLAQPKLRYGDGPICLVLVPTRELAQQVMHVCKEFCGNNFLKAASLYGGSSKNMQLRELQRTPEIVVATPGRLIDLLKMKKINLQRCTYVVLDEADRMLDMGFKPQITQIFSQIRPDRQTLMWSATWPKEVKALAQEYLSDYIQVTIGSMDLQANKNITQIVEVVSESQKDDKLMAYLKQNIKNERAIIFVTTKKKADVVARALKHMGYSAESIHGDKEQHYRDSILKAFKDSKINLLIATDVASRGLDIDDINFVINVDFPNQTEDYVHRIGRTARKDKFGTSYTLFTSANAKAAGDLVKVLESAGQNVPQALYNLVGSRGGGGGRGGRSNYGRSGGSSGGYSSYKRPYDTPSGSYQPPSHKRFNDGGQGDYKSSGYGGSSYGGGGSSSYASKYNGSSSTYQPGGSSSGYKSSAPRSGGYSSGWNGQSGY